jgi:hypothetical protein
MAEDGKDDDDYVVPPPRFGPGATDPASVQERLIGAAVGQLLVAWPLWIARRVESVVFTDEGAVHRQMSVDFQLPATSLPAQSRLYGPALAFQNIRNATLAPPVPLATLPKATLSSDWPRHEDRPGLLTRFDLWDEKAHRLSMLSKAATGRIAGAALAQLAEATAGRTLESPVRKFFYEVAGREPEDAIYLLKSLEIGFKETTREFGAHPDKGFFEFVLTLYGRETFIASLLNKEDGGLRRLCNKLASEFILLVVIDGDPYRRRVIKFAREEAIGTEISSALERVKEIATRLSWRPKEYVLDVPGIGTAESHHFEIVAPDFTEMIRADFVAVEPNGVSRRVTDKTQRSYAHVRLSSAEASSLSIAWTQVRLRATRRGLVTVGSAIAAFTAVVFWLGQGRLSHVEGAAAAAILLAAPALLVAYLARPGEHAIASIMLSGFRLLLAMSALCLFIGAGAIAGEIKTHSQALAAVRTATSSTPANPKSGSPSSRQPTPSNRSAGQSSGTRKPRGPYLDSIWAGLKWAATIIAVALFFSYLLPLRPGLKNDGTASGPARFG